MSSLGRRAAASGSSGPKKKGAGGRAAGAAPSSHGADDPVAILEAVTPERLAKLSKEQLVRVIQDLFEIAAQVEKTERFNMALEGMLREHRARRRGEEEARKLHLARERRWIERHRSRTHQLALELAGEGGAGGVSSSDGPSPSSSRDSERCGAGKLPGARSRGGGDPAVDLRWRMAQLGGEAGLSPPASPKPQKKRAGKQGAEEGAGAGGCSSAASPGGSRREKKAAPASPKVKGVGAEGARKREWAAVRIQARFRGVAVRLGERRREHEVEQRRATQENLARLEAAREDLKRAMAELKIPKK